ncbi:hypothetical protein DFH27DRAFT_236036 [Peziza echinospora]|nr:hypothetical protein DFH27DRAFT_236036 [Peziza echinospora]
MDHWAITTSSGRRVSLLCDDDNDSYSYSSACSNSAPTPPLSPDTRKARAYREGSTSSGSSSSSVRSYSPPHYSPQTPPNFSLPPLEKLLPVHGDQFFPSLASSRSNSFSSSSIASPLYPTHEESVKSKITPPSSIATISNPPSPKSTTSNPVIKRSSRRYTCQCGKSFTTSGHLARHTRIHTGEKNYVCPDHNCTARFSRQDNCMQHYRTHQSGSASKRAARRRRMSTDSSISGPDREMDTEPTSPASMPHHQRSLSYHSSQQHFSYNRLSGSFGSEDGLTALASVAIAYP